MVHDGLTLLQVSLVVPWFVLFGYKLLHPASTEHQSLLPVLTSLFYADQDQAAGLFKKIIKNKYEHRDARWDCFKAWPLYRAVKDLVRAARASETCE